MDGGGNGGGAELTAGERRFVEAAMGARGDEVRWVAWVLKLKRDKVQDRLLVLGRYRLLSIKRSKVSGKKAIQREGHYFDLTRVRVGDVPGLGSTGVTFEFGGSPPFVVEVSTPRAQEVLDAFRDARRALGSGFKADTPRLDAPSSQGWDQPDLGPCGGLVETYEAWCNYYQLKPNHGLVQNLKDTEAAGKDELALSSCPGIELRTDYSINLLPLFSALNNNTYFTALSLSSIAGRREAAALLASTLEHNTHLQRVTLSGLDAQPDAFVAVGTALKKNTNNGLQEVDFSHNRMGEKGALGFAQGLMGLQRGLVLLNLANNAITPRGISSVVSSLSDNLSIATTLTSLDLSANKIEKSGSQVLSYWATNLKDKSVLRDLNLADTSLDVFNVLNSLRLGLSNTLTSLNLAHNRLEKIGAQAIGLLIESSSCLSVLNLAFCKASPADISTILAPLAGNNRIHDLILDLSGNDLGSTGAQHLAKGLTGIDNIHTLILRENRLKDDGLRLVVSALMQKKSLKCVDLSYNIAKIGGSHYKDCLAMLADWLRSGGGANNLETLVLCGDGKSYGLGPNFAESLLALGENKSLTELDISGNKIGDAGLMKVFDNLRANTALTWIAFDNNGAALGSLQALKNCVANGNQTLLTVRFPSNDVSRAAGGNPRMHERLHELLTEVTEGLRENRTKNPAPRPSNIRMIQEAKKGANYGTIRHVPNKDLDPSASPPARADSFDSGTFEPIPQSHAQPVPSYRASIAVPTGAIPPPPMASPGRSSPAPLAPPALSPPPPLRSSTLSSASSGFAPPPPLSPPPRFSPAPPAAGSKPPPPPPPARAASWEQSAAEEYAEDEGQYYTEGGVDDGYSYDEQYYGDDASASYPPPPPDRGGEYYE